MKKKLYLFIFLLSFVSLGLNEAFAQVPQSFLYQAEARDSRGKILEEERLSVRVTILQDDITEVYNETHAVQTDMNGLFNLRVGEGDVIEYGNFSTIDWDNGTYFLNIQIAVGASMNYTDMGSTQILSVPYALHAETVSNIDGFSVDDDDADPSNELQDLEINGDILKITLNNDATEIDLSPYLDNSNLTEEEVDAMVDNNGYQLDINDGDVDATNEFQSLSIADHNLTISDGNTIPLPDNVDDADADPTNEIQDLSLVGNVLTITKNGLATEIDLSPYLDNSTLTEEQVDEMVSNNGYQLQINDGDVDATNEFQSLSVTDHELTISDGNTIALPDNVDDADADPTNELITDAVLNGSNLEITDAGGTRTIDLGSLGGSSSPWTVSGNDVYRFLGNVGIGTNQPSYRLDVNGNMHVNGSVRANKLLIPATTQYYSIAGCTFTPTGSTSYYDSRSISYIAIHPNEAWGDADLVAPVHIPSGATLENISAKVLDNGPATITVSLYLVSYSGGYFNLGSTNSSINSSAIQNLTGSLSSTVDNNNNAFVAVVRCQGTYSTSTYYRIYKVTIRYSISALP